MDRENADREPADLALVEAVRANAPSGPTLVSVCITCRTADGATVVGPDMFDAGNEFELVRALRTRIGQRCARDAQPGAEAGGACSPSAAQYASHVRLEPLSA